MSGAEQQPGSQRRANPIPDPWSLPSGPAAAGRENVHPSGLPAGWARPAPGSARPCRAARSARARPCAKAPAHRPVHSLTSAAGAAGQPPRRPPPPTQKSRVTRAATTTTTAS